MKNAKEMREITNKKLEEMNASKIKEVKNYIEKVIAPEIEEKASQGKESLIIAINIARVDIHEVIKELVVNGYKVMQGTKYSNITKIKIYW